jgi:hypothetical protein
VPVDIAQVKNWYALQRTSHRPFSSTSLCLAIALCAVGPMITAEKADVPSTSYEGR